MLDRLAVEDIFSFIRHIQAAHDIHERRFAGTGRSDDTDKFSLFDLHGSMVECSYLLASDMINLRNIPKCNHRHHRLTDLDVFCQDLRPVRLRRKDRPAYRTAWTASDRRQILQIPAYYRSGCHLSFLYSKPCRLRKVRL